MLVAAICSITGYADPLVSLQLDAVEDVQHVGVFSTAFDECRFNFWRHYVADFVREFYLMFHTSPYYHDERARQELFFCIVMAAWLRQTVNGASVGLAS